MFNHLEAKEVRPKRVVVLGAKGFIGSTAVMCLKDNNVPVVEISRQQVDFSSAAAAEYIADILQPDDVVLIAAAKAPCKNYTMLLDNILMLKNICDALAKRSVTQIIYISSDAVYADSMQPLTESSPAAPTSLHGVMHLAREQMLASIIEAEKLLFLRPTLVYGADDPHNGYGPNQFVRLAQEGKTIKLFGQGEERRDHVHVDDVAEIIRRCLFKRSYGVLNVVTGQITSFFEVAEKVNRLTTAAVEIKSLPRSGPMPHNGYRAFDISVCQKYFPDFSYMNLDKGLQYLQAEKLKEVA
ncbi:MAG: SDR family oxidoreductase [Gammaproteobacteria bacterium]|nr:SDR family oxidoreductase [Gammaproteobacteria bacterium]